MRASLARLLANVLLAAGVVLTAFTLIQLTGLHEWLLERTGLASHEAITLAEAATPTPRAEAPILLTATPGIALTARATTVLPTTVLTPMPTPTPLPIPGRLIIPSIQVDAKVQAVTVQDGEWQVVSNAVGYSEGTGIPGRLGNAVFAGHVDVEGEVFRRLKNVRLDDEVLVVSGHEVYPYQVSKISIVNSEDTWVMNPAPDTAEVTLVTCWPDFFKWNVAYNSRRLIVQARLTIPPVDDLPAHSASQAASLPRIR